MQGKGFALAFPTTLQNAPRSLPPSRGKVASAKRMTDEGARQVFAPYRKNCLPAPPPHPPQCAHWGTFPPEGGRLALQDVPFGISKGFPSFRKFCHIAQELLPALVG